MKNKLFICSYCNYRTNRKNNYDNHISSFKHKKNIECKEDKYKYFCSNCNYKTNLKNSFLVHLETNKHKEINLCEKDDTIYDFEEQNDKTNQEDKIENDNKLVSLVENINILINEKNTLVEEKNSLVERIIILVEKNALLIEENNELKKMVANINPQNNLTNIETQNNIHTQNNFNLNFFLNETCKDAMNIDDFIDSIEVTVQDLKYLAINGYVEGLSKLLIKNLEVLDVTKRPLHCSDLKRETVHIKNKYTWEKDNIQKTYLTKVATDISRLNTIALQSKYQEKYPKCLTDFKSKEHQEYSKIAYEAFGGKLNINDANRKLFRNILKVIAIDKSEYKNNVIKS